MTSILTIVCGQEPDSIFRQHGNYLDWFQNVMPEVDLVPWHIQESIDEPSLSAHAGVLITGSPASAARPEPWMEVVIETIRSCAESNQPLLGICFGHQLVGCAYGAATIKAPDEGELGSLPIQLTEKGISDHLFAGCSETFLTQLTHHDQVDPDAIAHSNGLRVLASSANTAVQALAGGEWIRSVQFHPEFDRAIMQSYVDLDGNGQHVEDCHQATKVLSNWLRGWVL